MFQITSKNFAILLLFNLSPNDLKKKKYQELERRKFGGAKKSLEIC